MRKDASAYVRCAVLSYGYTLDADGATGVADAAGQFGFVNPCAGQSVEDLPPATFHCSWRELATTRCLD
jgi:hypothetical protein